MEKTMHPQLKLTNRYKVATEKKTGGATYTPKLLADFVASQILSVAPLSSSDEPLRVLDPAVGDGELLVSLLERLDGRMSRQLEVFGFETDAKALNLARERLCQRFPRVPMQLAHGNFLEFVLEHFGEGGNGSLFRTAQPITYDVIIANPPYVRTQIMGADQAQLLARQFGLVGRVDLYYAFLMGMAQVLKPSAVAGIIVSNRFMTTKSGAAVRRAIRKCFRIHHVWDFGDTKLFDAAVLPAVLLVERRNGHTIEPALFTSIYETTDTAHERAADVIEALSHVGIVEIDDGRRFRVKRGQLDDGGIPDAVWRVATAETDSWLATVQAHTWGTFRNIGKIRVGVKTCADKVFIRSDWDDLPHEERPELLRPLTTHHAARRFRAAKPKEERLILYPHEYVNGTRCAVNLDRYPRACAYLEKHRATLEERKYVLEAGRQWYEIWVPQDPESWAAPKLVFRDISEKPTFWIDTEGGIVNGDCYWLTCERAESEHLLWLAAAVANSTFIEAFYDHCFNNKLYAGRRRFITQYVERFPLPNPETSDSRRIVQYAKHLFKSAGTPEADVLARELNQMVWKAFGLPVEEVSR